ncbi:hypothetical protein H261_03463 [Paramagnetospirillum caucaseum]|uniref:Uncharacterized protein n=1 Tax=Paramagnetospirillum caucaseum TaxID=1244869 RepID=M2ZAK0_9PROT|nr:hypothetical protein [Paramagnetospirillum caucaseum]EME71435.1 hypothetical protein H261_03463 [Paramagnetospirillum caucaseum]
MTGRGPEHLRKTTNVVLDALVRAAEQALHGHAIDMRTLESLVAELKESTAFDDFYHRSYREMMEVVEGESIEQRRTNAFGRLMMHPLSGLFSEDRLDRGLVPNIFSFLRMVLGDEDEAQHAERCNAIVKVLRDDLGDSFSWDAFYDDPEAKAIQWHVLVKIAGSFKRYDLRKDWFIKLMQYRPTTVSLASNAFVTKEHSPYDDPIQFGEREFCMFFHAMFDPLQNLDRKDEAAFQKEFGTDPHHLIGGFLVNLAACMV